MSRITIIAYEHHDRLPIMVRILLPSFVNCIYSSRSKPKTLTVRSHSREKLQLSSRQTVGKKTRVGNGDKLRSLRCVGAVLNERGKRPIEDHQTMSTIAKTNSPSSISLSNGSTCPSISPPACVYHILTNTL